MRHPPGNKTEETREKKNAGCLFQPAKQSRLYDADGPIVADVHILKQTQQHAAASEDHLAHHGYSDRCVKLCDSHTERKGNSLISLLGHALTLKQARDRRITEWLSRPAGPSTFMYRLVGRRATTTTTPMQMHHLGVC